MPHERNFDGSDRPVAAERPSSVPGARTGSPVPLWRINGYRARLLIWTPDEWEKMDAPPPDAQYHPSGVWCALRMD